VYAATDWLEGRQDEIEEQLAPLISRVRAGRLAGAARIGVEAGKVINKCKTGKHRPHHHR
jgi:hypothetical protein